MVDQDQKRNSLTRTIFLAMLIGLVCGLILNFTGLNETSVVKQWLTGGLFSFLGQIFIRGIKMLVVPLVFFSIAAGTASMTDIRKLGRVGSRIMIFYMSTTVIALIIALGVANLINPGIGFVIPSAFQGLGESHTSLSMLQTLIQIVPDNPIASMAEGNMLQVIFFAVLTGIALTLIRKRKSDQFDSIGQIIEKSGDLMLEMVSLVMRLLAPIGVFGLLAKAFTEMGFDLMFPLLKYMLAIIASLLIHVTITYPGLLLIFSRLNPWVFFQKFFSTMVVAFSTSSSNATLPVTLETTEKKLGVKKEIAAFTIPLGATINMDGTAIMQGVATVFIAQISGIHLTMLQYVTVIFMALLASIGTAGVPGVGLVMLIMVLDSVGLKAEYIGLIMGIDRILDMMRTAVNVTGDAVCTCVVAKMENELDLQTYYGVSDSHPVGTN